MPVAHQAAAARLGLEIGMSMQEITDLRLNGLCQQGTCPAAQNLGERIREGPWLRKLENVTVDHSFGGEVEALNTPTIRRLTPLCRHQLSRLAPAGIEGTARPFPVCLCLAY